MDFGSFVILLVDPTMYSVGRGCQEDCDLDDWFLVKTKNVLQAFGFDSSRSRCEVAQDQFVKEQESYQHHMTAFSLRMNESRASTPVGRRCQEDGHLDGWLLVKAKDVLQAFGFDFSRYLGVRPNFCRVLCWINESRASTQGLTESII